MEGQSLEPADELLASLVDMDSAELRDLLDEEWKFLAESLSQEAAAKDDLRRKLLAQPSEFIFEIEKVDPNFMGIAITAGALFVLKFVLAKLVEAAATAAATALLDEIITRIGKQRGPNFLKKVKPASSKTPPLL